LLLFVHRVYFNGIASSNPKNPVKFLVHVGGENQYFAVGGVKAKENAAVAN
jgi:hypothetical protein